MEVQWSASPWHFGSTPIMLQLPVMSVAKARALLAESRPFIDSFCQPEFNGTWASISSELGVFTPCFIDIVILGTAHIAMLLLAIARFRLLYVTPPRERLAKPFRGAQVVASVLALFCAVVPLMQLSARVSFTQISKNSPLPPSEIVSLVLASIAWAATALALFRELRSTTAIGHWYLRFAIIYVLVGQVAKLRNVILLQRNYNTFFVWLFMLYTAAHGLLGFYAVLFFPVREHARGRHRHWHLYHGSDEAPAQEAVAGLQPQPEAAGATAGYQPLPGTPPEENVFPEHHANFFSRITFAWMGPLLKEGHKRPLQDTDVWQLDPTDSAEVISQKFNSIWEEERKRPNPRIIRALHRCFGPRFWYAGLFKGMDNLCQFVGPVMLSSLLSAMQSDEPAWHGYVYATAIFSGIVLGVIFDAQFFTNVQRVGFQIRQALVAAVFSKSLQLSHMGRQGFSSGRIVNMMTGDTETLQLVVQQLHNVWSAPFRIVLCMVLLYRELGIAALISLLVLLILIPLQAFMMTQQRKLVKQSLQKADRRIGLMNEILASMDVVKCYAWEDSFKAKVLTVRCEELGRLRLASYISAVNFFVVNSVPVMVTVVGFTFFALLGGNLTPAKAFTSISLFSILRMPLYMLPQLVNQVVNANVSIKRLRDMLLAEERPSDPTPSPEPGKPIVEVHGSSFTWGGQADKHTLQDISIAIEEGALVAIVGATGQGKSSLISALIGEMPPVEGDPPPIVRGRLAYVSQVPWIFNATMRDNILFGLPYDAQRYARAIRVSALERDLEILQGGDLTEIGERGVNLSGGQKQRLSIARAVYADADVYFFDDPLSALDAHVAKQVFDSCILDALRGKTRIMVTNQLHFLPNVDKVVLVEQGRVMEQGSYDELMSQGNHFQQLMEQAGSMEEDGEIEAHADSNGGVVPAPAATVSQEAASPPHALQKVLSKRDARAAEEAPVKGKAGTQLVTVEDRETGVVSLSVIGRYMHAMGGVWALVLLLGLYAMVEVPRVGSSLWVGVWSGAEATGEAGHTVRFYIAVYALICSSQVLFVLSRQFWMAIASLRAAQRLHEAMLHSILQAPMAFFQANPLGRLINRFTKDTSDIDKNLPQQGTLFLQYFFQLLSTFGLIGALNSFALWAIVPLLLVFYFVYNYFQDTARELKRLDAITRSPVYAQFGEALNGQATIRSYRAQDRMARINGRAMDRNTRYAVANMSANRWLAVRLEFLGGLMVWATASFAVMDVQRAVDQAALAATMGIILSYALTITMIMTNVLRLASQFENSFNAVERVGTYADVEPEAPAVIEGRRPPPEWPTEGAVLFDCVRMRYRADLPPVLKGLTVDVKGGEKVGVVGRTGAGKSSLFNALFRIVEIESGKILIDDLDIAQFGVQDVRRALMIIPQTPVLFTGTIRFNLDPFEEHDDVAVWEALGRAHMRDLISRMVLGLQTQVEEGGDNFSVGQRQLLSLARALLRHSKILVLDEATAAVDVGTDALIQKTIREEFKDCTMLIIAHRLNTIIDSDRILVMDNGQAVEYDTPAQLVANQNSLFCGMVRSTGAANAKHLMRVACGEVDVKEELAAPAAAEAQKWAQEATTRRWKDAAHRALAQSLTASHQDLTKAGEEGDLPGILSEARRAALTLEGILSGERAAELEAALRQAGIEEGRWWTAFLRVIQGLAVMGRHWQSHFGDEDDTRAGLLWSRRLELEGRDEEDD